MTFWGGAMESLFKTLCQSPASCVFGGGRCTNEGLNYHQKIIGQSSELQKTHSEFLLSWCWLPSWYPRQRRKMTSEPVLMLNVECWMLLISVSWNLTWGACFAHFSGGEHQRSFKPWLTWVSHEKLGKNRTPERQKKIRSFPPKKLELQVSSGLQC